MRNIFLLVILFWSISFYSCSNDTHYNDPDIKDDTYEQVDTMEYRALVYANMEVVNERYGGENEFNRGLKQLFNDITLFWNASKNKFKYYFKFKPTGLRLYPTADFDKTMSNEVHKSLDAQYDFVMVFNLDSDHNGAACGGGNGFAVVTMHKTLEDQNVYGDIFHNGNVMTKEWGVYNTLGHEFGHFRGATDIYQYGIPAENNPINGEAFEEPKCNMCNSGEWIWSDYASAVFNYTAKWKRVPSNWGPDRFPSSIEIIVCQEDKPLKNAVVKFYGCRGGGEKTDMPSGNTSPDVYKNPFREYTTNDNGKIIIDDVEHLYQVRVDTEPNLPESLPWNYWFNFLVETLHPTSGKKQYMWLPDLEIQRDHLENDTKVYNLKISF